VAFYATQADLDKFTRSLAGLDWFAFLPAKEVVQGVIDVAAVARQNLRASTAAFAWLRTTSPSPTARPVKFWGVNLSYYRQRPRQGDSRLHRRPLRQVRRQCRAHAQVLLPHQPDGQSATPTTRRAWTPRGWIASTTSPPNWKENGVYFGWSHTYGFHVVPGDKKRLLAYDEIAKNLNGNTYAFINFADDVQDLMIEMVVNLLKHKNPTPASPTPRSRPSASSSYRTRTTSSSTHRKRRSTLARRTASDSWPSSRCG